MSLGDYIATLRKRWLSVVVLAVLGATGSYALAQSTPPSYRATSKVFVSLAGGESVSELAQGSNYAQNVVRAYAQLVSMPVVLDPVIDDLGLDTTARGLSRTVSAESPLGTPIIEISAVSGSPDGAADVANAAAEHLAEAVEELSPAPDGDSGVVLNIVSPAVPPGFAFSPNTRLMTATGLAGGGALGVALVLGAALLDTRIRSVRDLAALTDDAVLGSIPYGRLGRRGGPVMTEDPRSPQAEAYRRLQTNLRYLDTSGPLRSLVVTSALPREGKSSTALNLALAVAETGQRVLLVDADLRRPSLERYTGLEGAAGLTTVLIGRARLDEVVQPWSTPTLEILTTGEMPPNPSQLLDSRAMAELVAEAVEEYDLVVVDSPPLLPVVDAAILARLTGGALVVAGSRRVRRHQLVEALDVLDAVDARRLGIVLNAVVSRGGDPVYTYESDGRLSPPSRLLGRAGRRGRRPAAGVSSTPLLPHDPPQHAAHRPAHAASWVPVGDEVPEGADEQVTASGPDDGTGPDLGTSPAHAVVPAPEVPHARTGADADEPTTEPAHSEADDRRDPHATIDPEPDDVLPGAADDTEDEPQPRVTDTADARSVEAHR